MALSRNQRRKLRKERLAAKAERLNKAMLAKQQDYVKGIVLQNLSGPVETKEERIERLALRGPLARMTGKPHLAREMVSNASAYRRMAMERWITSKPQSHKK